MKEQQFVWTIKLHNGLERIIGIFPILGRAVEAVLEQYHAETLSKSKYPCLKRVAKPGETLKAKAIWLED